MAIWQKLYRKKVVELSKLHHQRVLLVTLNLEGKLRSELEGAWATRTEDACLALRRLEGSDLVQCWIAPYRYIRIVSRLIADPWKNNVSNVG